MPLTGKTIFITGAARRLGKAAALACANEGADLILHFNSSLQEINETCEQVQLLGRKCWTVQANLSSPDEIQNLTHQLLNLPPLYALINNASIFKSINMQGTSLEDWDQHMMTNLTAPFLLIQNFAEHYSLDEPGRVINLVDWRALRPGKDHFPYTISKAGLVALTRASALALAPRITVNAIALGAILPPENEPENNNILRHVPLQRWSTLDEFTATVLFLLQGPSYITGETIHLDGGRHLV